MKDVHSKSIRTISLLLIVFSVQAIVCLYIAYQKQYLFTDEVYSYGLANSETTAFIDPGESPKLMTAWQDNSYFRNYIKFDTSRSFSFQAAFANQAKDVHPPLYYCLLHLMCAFFPNTVYSAFPGILLNVLFLLVADFLLYYITLNLTKSWITSFSVLLFWGLSASCFSNVVLIRMYMLQTVQILAVIAYHLWKKDKSSYVLLDALELILLICLGGLTQYYFYIFAAVFGACICMYMLASKRFKLFVGYAASLWAGVIMALAIFPATIKYHLSGYRGSYATDSIGKFTFEKFRLYGGMINKELLAGIAKPILFVLLACAICKVITWATNLTVTQKEHYCEVRFTLKKLTFEEKQICLRLTENLLLIVTALIASAAFFYVAVQGSEIINVRYIYPVFPVVAMLIGCFFAKVLHKKAYQLICCVIALSIALLSTFTNGIDWAYLDYKNQISSAKSLQNVDCVIINRADGWWNVLQAINVYIDMNEIRALNDTDINRFQEILDERVDPSDKVCVAIPADNHYTDDEKSALLDEILENTFYTHYTRTYDYYTVIYTLE